MSFTSVSLPEHLRSALDPLPDILPSDLRERLLPYLAECASEIPHLLLSDIAKWARTDPARTQLRARHLEPSQYSIISLLAGTITSPLSKLPPYMPSEDALAVSKRAADDRKAITAIMNALLSVGGAGYAAWWASSRTEWRDEWRMLFALLVASVLAVSESILYLIWQSRKDRSRRRQVYQRAHRSSKRDDDSNEGRTVDDSGEDEGVSPSEGLRKRKTRLTGE